MFISKIDHDIGLGLRAADQHNLAVGGCIGEGPDSRISFAVIQAACWESSPACIARSRNTANSRLPRSRAGRVNGSPTPFASVYLITEINALRRKLGIDPPARERKRGGA